MELSLKQKTIVTTQEPRVVVQSAAGSGKTATLVARLQHLLNTGVDPKSIVAITFTNAASEEILDRLDHPKGLFIGTIHSLANYYLLSGGVDTKKIIVEQQFDKLFELIQQHQECVHDVEYLLLDEGQDSTPQQFEFMLDIINPRNWMIFADIRQSIYRWAGADPNYIIRLMHREDVTVFYLDGNYRCGSKILNYAKGIIRLAGADYYDTSIAMRDEPGRVVDVVIDYVGIARTLKEMKNYGDWFILTRKNDQLDDMMKHLQKAGIPCVSFKRAELDNKQLAEKMKENTVKVLTIHTAKGLEAKNVMVIGAKFFDIEEKCISYVAATRAKDLLVWVRENKRRKPVYSNWEI